MKRGTTVRLIQPVIQGEVMDRQINPATDVLEYLVAWTENDQPVQGWFTQAQLEEVQS